MVDKTCAPGKHGEDQQQQRRRGKEEISLAHTEKHLGYSAIEKSDRRTSTYEVMRRLETECGDAVIGRKLVEVQEASGEEGPSQALYEHALYCKVL